MSFYHNILAFLWAFFIVVFAIPSIISVAHIKQLLDAPNLRTVHASLTPRLGGIAIFAGFISAVTIFGDLDYGVQEIIASSILMFFIGLKDDIVSVSAFKKFFVQVLAAGIVMFMGKIRITSFYGILGIYELDPGISSIVTFLVIIGVTNAVNLIDGVDGLAGSIVLVICFLFGISFFFWGSSAFKPYAALAFSLMGAMAGFLRYNLHKAIIFMGDTGSLVAGFIVSLLAVQFVEMKAFEYSPVLAISILFVPIIDTVRVFVIRVLNGVSPFSPDKNHLHHRLVSLGLNHIATVCVLLLVNLIAVSLIVFFRSYSNNTLFLLLIIYGLLIVGGVEAFYIRKCRKLTNAV